MSARLADFECQFSTRAPTDNDDVLTIRPRDVHHMPEMSDLRANHFARYSFEEDLRRSRVYSRVQIYNSDTSTISTHNKSTAWSYWSSISLSEISNISVLNLLITPSEIYNSEHYSSHSAYSRIWKPLPDYPAMRAGSRPNPAAKRILLLGTFYGLLPF